MTAWTIIRRSLTHRARAHVGVFLGAAVGSAVLIGALIVGDSVRGSLRQLGLARLGNIHYALPANDRLVRAELAGELQSTFGAQAAPVFQLVGTAARGDGSARANQVQIIGMDGRFWRLGGGTAELSMPGEDQVAINARLAAQLNVSAGDQVLLRIHKPSRLGRDVPLASDEDVSVALRLGVGAVIPDDTIGRFSLQANQVPPYNAFLPLARVQRAVGETNRANLLLLGQLPAGTGETDAVERLQDTLKKAWKLADAQLELRALEGAVELRSERVFIDPPVVEAARDTGRDFRPVLTYFVNQLRVGDRMTPYSMVTAAGEPWVPEAMRDDEILITRWLADDLQAGPGDEIELRYFTVREASRLEERVRRFRVHAVVPMEGRYADRTLMPDFPGVAEAESSNDWDTGFPIEFGWIRDQDETYWEEHRGTPKAFVTLAAGKGMWGNRYGGLTGLRFGEGDGPSGLEELRTALLERIEPASLGLRFQAVREQALAASAQSMDFGQLFLGFSFFLIAAALLLMGLLFQLGLEQRATEIGTLLALGLPPRQVRRWLLMEGAGIAGIGGAFGVGGGILYARAMVGGLTTLWKDAVGTSALEFHMTPLTLLIGLAASVVVGTLTLWLALRRQGRRPARELLAEGADSEAMEQSPVSRKRGRALWIGVASAVGALALVGWALAKGDQANAGAFFGAGALLLVAGLAFTSALLTRLAGVEASARLTLRAMGVRGCARRRKRSLASVALLACGSFLVVAVGANKLDATHNATERSSGTGGFALIGEATMPVLHDLNSREGREHYGLSEALMEEVRVVPFRVRDGDDASCLNLNRAQTPRLLGVDPELLHSRGAFTFAGVAGGYSREDGWRLLASGAGADDRVPAVGDQNSILWALRMRLGDALEYEDARGASFEVQIAGALANSILQGSLIVSEAEFVKRFPGESGYRTFLIDAPSNRVDEVARELSRALSDAGLELTAAAERLAAYNAVQNTYLDTFQILGGLGLLLGSAGLGVVVLRNVLERRGELALLLAVGFRRGSLRRLVLSEHAVLLWLGLGLGVLAALVAVLPALLSPGAEIPYGSLAVTLALVMFSGMVWTWLATRVALRGRLLDALRGEG